MTPQSSFMVLAAVEAGRSSDLRRLLDSMNATPGVADPGNALISFGSFEALHFARFLVIDDDTVSDVEAYGMTPVEFPLYLAFLGDVDGEAATFLDELAARCAPGLRAAFSCCEDFTLATDLPSWMRRHLIPSATSYVNWRGRTVKQVREEAALHVALRNFLDQKQSPVPVPPPQQTHRSLREFVRAEVAGGRMSLTRSPATPFGWALANLADLVLVPLVLLVASPLLVIAGIVALLRIRQLEKTDPEICPRPDPRDVEILARAEDRDVTNQFSAIGSLKPGLVRRVVSTFVLRLLDYTTRHVYARGRLARARTIHFARWVWLDDKRRLLFASNYDGSLESYMDDFINKAGFGLNLVFSNGIGYPRANWLLRDGAKDEQKFKQYLRRHQLATQVWYKAYPGLTTFDQQRNSAIRQGLEAQSLSDAAASEWLALI